MPRLSVSSPAAIGRLLLGAGVLLLGLVLVACSSDEGGGDASPGAESGGGSPAQADGTLPLGTAWDTSTVAELEGIGRITGMTTLGDSAWITGTRWNAPRLWRSTDGVAWDEIEVAPPDDDLVSIDGILERDGGGYVAYGKRSWGCYEWEGSGPYRSLEQCRRDRPVIFLSDDGTSWREIEPASMEPPGDQSVVLASVARYAGGYVAVGTVQGPDWHGRIWTSPDGEDWTLASEVRGEQLTSLEQVLSDGEQIVVIASGHECGEPRDISQGGWNLGVTWLNQFQLYEGTDPAALQLLAPAEHPLLREPMAIDCDRVIELPSRPDGWADGVMVAGRITLVERDAPGDTREDESRVRRIATLADGAWSVEEVTLPPISSASGWLVDVDGAVGITGDNGRGSSRGLGALWAVVPADGGWEHRDAGNRVLWTRAEAATYFDGSLLVAGTLLAQPFSSRITVGDPSAIVVARSRPVSVAEWNACTVEAGAVCPYRTFEQVEGFPDFGGADLSGADLTAGNLEGANFDGASFRDAVLVGVGGSIGTSFVETDFTGADLRGAELSHVARANFTNANLGGADIDFEDTITLEGASLYSATLGQGSVGGTYRPLELSLAGLDLRQAWIRGPYQGEPLLVITDLRGATVENTRFNAVDLSSADVSGVDLSQVYFDEFSICPNGAAPTGESFRLQCE